MLQTLYLAKMDTKTITTEQVVSSGANPMMITANMSPEEQMERLKRQAEMFRGLQK